MKPHVKTGLIVGAVGLVINIFVSALLGLCGPVVALIGGAVAGLLTVNQAASATRTDNTRRGAIAAGIAGLLTELGQLIGGIGVLAMAQSLGWQLPFGQIPGPGSPSQVVVGYWVGGILVVGCFGTLGLLLAVGAGALLAYLRSVPGPADSIATPGGPDQPV